MIPKEQMDEFNRPRPPMSNRTLVLLIVLLIGFLFVLRGQRSASSDAEPNVPDRGTLIAAAQMMVRQHLRDPGSATFSDIVVHSGTGARSSIVCGRVNARNGFGGMAGPERFVVGDATALESEVGAEAMAELWARAC